MPENPKMGPGVALKKYMEKGAKWGRPLPVSEIKSLSPEERTELGNLAMIALEEDWD